VIEALAEAARKAWRRDPDRRAVAHPVDRGRAIGVVLADGEASTPDHRLGDQSAHDAA
jgi:hypothetical protein